MATNGNIKATDKQIKKALIDAGGMPTQAAKILNIEYVTIYLRIRANPELMAIQKSQRSKTFQDLQQITVLVAKSGHIQKSVLDENGKLTNETELVKVSENLQLDAAFRLMGMFKGDEDIAEEVNVNIKGSVSPEKWITAMLDKSDNDPIDEIE